LLYEQPSARPVHEKAFTGVPVQEHIGQRAIDENGYKIGYEFSRGKRAEQLLILKLLACGLTIQL